MSYSIRLVQARQTTTILFLSSSSKIMINPMFFIIQATMAAPAADPKAGSFHRIPLLPVLTAAIIRSRLLSSYPSGSKKSFSISTKTAAPQTTARSCEDCRRR